MTRHRAAAAFAIPGDLSTVTGGYIYERRLLDGLRAAGHDVAHLPLGASFPDPTAQDAADALRQMGAMPETRPIIVDGLVFGALIGLAQLRAPLIGMIHHPLAFEEGLSPDRRAHLHRTEAANIALARHILVPSAYTRDLLVSDYAADPSCITIASPGLDPPTRLNVPSAPPLILSVGILHPRKGHDVLLDALSRIQHLDWRAVIVGSDYDTGHAAALKARCQALGLDERVTFAGLVAQDALEDLYAEATLFALATRFEGYGIVFAEALARGVPVVGTTAGAVPDTVPQGAGLLVPPVDAGAFAAALARILTDSSARAALAAGAAQAGRTLPRWADTARIASKVLAQVAAEP